jgi:DNA helicase-2/ATP-dependent DNA helicase PcrA
LDQMVTSPGVVILNSKQREAVLQTEGPLLILAGAGSGKTGVLTHRIARLLGPRKIPANRVLAVSFTNKAADEMRRRVDQMVPRNLARGLTICTFHSLAVRILREDIAILGYKNNFTILDANDQLGLLKKAMKEIRIDDRKFKAEWILSNISRAKNGGIEPEQYSLEPDGDYEVMTAAVYPRYEESLRALNALDFDDLMRLAVALLSRHDALRDKYRDRYRYIMIDEYQDTNHSQYRLAHLLGGGHQNLCVVGDDDQSIYSWRGGEVGNILRFTKDFPSALTITLEQNYRSTQRILQAANAVISHNRERTPKNLWSDRGLGERVGLVEVADEAEEGRLIAERVFSLKLRHGARFNQFGVLTRTNQQTRPIEEAFRLNNIPYELIGGIKFYDRKEVKDFLAYLRVVLNPEDEISWLRILNYPARGIGRSSAIRLNEHARKSGTALHEVLRHSQAVKDIPLKAHEGLADLMSLIDRYRSGPGSGGLAAMAQKLLDEIEMREAIRAEESDPMAAERRIENLGEVISGIQNYEKSVDPAVLSGYLDKICLMSSDEEPRDESGNGVRIMTIHSAKGLEFPFVLLPGLEEEFLPHKRSIESAEALCEERRLFYVAITRAQRQLVISYTRTRHRFNRSLPRLPSRFLAEIPDELLDKELPGVVPATTDKEEDDLGQAFFSDIRRMLNR